MRSSKARTPSQNMQIIVRDPHKPRRSFKPSEMACQLAEDRRALERRLEDLELASQIREVWE